MKGPLLSEQPVTEEEEQDFLTPPSRRKKRSLAARRAALRPWATGIGLTVLVPVAALLLPTGWPQALTSGPNTPPPPRHPRSTLTNSGRRQSLLERR